jgi:hypothetical protein
MGTQLTTIEPLPVPTAANPTPRLPAWFTNFEKLLKADEWAGKSFDVLPTMPTDEQRSAMLAHRDLYATALEQTPLNNDECAKRTLILIGKLVAAKPSRAAGAETIEARIETYNAALDDVPTWAVAGAIRKWHRGQCDNAFDYSGEAETFDYRWAPESADLRKIARREAWEVQKRIETLDRISAAVPYVDRTEERKRNNCAFAAILGNWTNKEVLRDLNYEQAVETGRKLIER